MPAKYKKKEDLIRKGVSVIAHFEIVSVITKEDFKSWPEHISYLVQMNLAKAEGHKCIILTPILNM